MAGGVEHFRHLVVVDTAEVMAEGWVDVLVFEGFGFALAASAALSVGGGKEWGVWCHRR